MVTAHSTAYGYLGSKSSPRARSPCASPSAAPARSCGRPCTSSCRAPAGPAAIGRGGGARHGELEMEMREGVAHQPVEDLPARRHRRLGERLGGRRACPRATALDGTSSMPPSSPLAGRLRSRMAPSLRASTKASPRRVGLSALGARRGSSSAMPSLRAAAAVMQRADDAARVARRADRGAEIHHRLGVVAGALLRAPARRRAPRSRSWRRAAASRWRTGGRSPARHCRRPPRPAGRRRWRGWRPAV